MNRVLLLTLALCLSVASCSRGLIFKAFNNSGEDLIIVSYDGKLVPHEFVVAAGATVDVQFPTVLIIKHPKGEWKYDLIRTDKRYHYTRACGLRVQDIQIESDGSIYIILPDQKYFGKHFNNQSYGYTIRPK